MAVRADTAAAQDGLTPQLIYRSHGVYDPASFNDRLLLGLKGTMSEAELHVIKARLRGGILNKVRRGEYRCPLPTGFTYDEVGEVAFDPNFAGQRDDRLFLRDVLAGGIGLSDREGLSQRGTLLSVSHPQPSADDFPAADDIDRDPDAEQSALRRRVRLWPAAIPAGCRWKEEASDPRAR